MNLVLYKVSRKPVAAPTLLQSHLTTLYIRVSFQNLVNFVNTSSKHVSPYTVVHLLNEFGTVTAIQEVTFIIAKCISFITVGTHCLSLISHKADLMV